MEASIPPFLVHLGLDTEADERAIRRAYAQRLKRVDQANEPHVFQALREAYETALRWCHWRRQSAAEAAAEAAADDVAPQMLTEGDAAAEAVTERTSEPAAETAMPAVTMAEPTPTQPAIAQPAADVVAAIDAPPSPQALADAVFAVFAERRDQVFTAEAQANEALEQALADDRLVNLEARALFEWQIACTLVEGWRPGHEFLFGPACTVFSWDRERRSLAVFGRVGATINTAIDERLMFFRLPPTEFDAYRQLIQQLRPDTTTPDANGLMRSMPALRMLAQRYPHWLRLITSQANFMRWDEAFKAIPAAQHEAYRQRSGKPAASSSQRMPTHEPFQKRESSFSPWWLIFAVFMLARLAGSFSSSPSHPHPSSSSRPTSQAPAPASRGEFTPLFDLSPTAPVTAQPAGTWPAEPKVLGTPARTATKPVPATDLNQRQGLVEAELKKLLAEPPADGRRGNAANARGAAGSADQTEQPDASSTPPSAGAYLEQQRKKLHAAEGTLPELGGSILSPSTGAAPHLSFDLTQPADAASAPPTWARPAPKL